MRKFLLAAILLPLSTAAFGQGTAITPEQSAQGTMRSGAGGPASTGTVVRPGGAENSGPGSIGTVAPGATGADSMSNNSAAAGNAGQNQRPIGNTGGGGK